MTHIPPQLARIYQFPRPLSLDRPSSASRSPGTCGVRPSNPSATSSIPQFRDSLALAKSVSSQSVVHSSQLNAHQTISEREMFTALAHYRLATRNPAAAQSMAEKLPEAARQFQMQNGYVDTQKVTESVLNTMVRSGELRADEFKSVRQFAFDQAQFDENRASLGVPNGAASESPELTLVEALERVSENALMQTSSLLADQTAPAGNSQKSKATGAVSGSHASSATSGIHAPDTGAPNDTFLWKPESDSNGRLVILLPASLTEDAVAVSLLSPDGSKVLAQGDFSGVGNGQRKHFRFPKSGGSYPPGTIVQITMKDGSQRQVRIDSTGQRMEKRGTIGG